MTATVAWTKPRPANPWTLPAGQFLLGATSPRETWLAARRNMICGSDIAKMLNASPYGDAFSVWADKTGRAPERAATDPMVRGSILEEGVIDLWATRYVDFPIELRRQGLVRSRRYEHAGATVDRLSICELGRCIVEVKTQIDLTEWLDGDTSTEAEVPAAYQLQGQWQLGVTGREHIHFVVLGPRFVPVHRIMYRDEELIDKLFVDVAEWWDVFVRADVPPSPTRRSSDLVRSLYGNPAAGRKFVLDGETAALFRALPILKADRDAATASYEDTLTQLQALVGDATEILWEQDDRKPAATWRATKTIDGVTKDFIAENRELVEPFITREEVEVVDVAKLAENHPELFDQGVLRRRRSFLLK